MTTEQPSSPGPGSAAPAPAEAPGSARPPSRDPGEAPAPGPQVPAAPQPSAAPGGHGPGPFPARPMSEVERAAAIAEGALVRPVVSPDRNAPSEQAGRRRFGLFKRRPPKVGTPSTAAVSPAPVPAPSDVAAEVQQDPQGTGAGTATKEPLSTARPPGAPPDPWTAFATTPERAPGLIRRATRKFLRSFIHEYALAIYGGLVLAVALTWPTLRYPLHTLPQDLGDPSRQAWQISWAGHILRTDPVRLWQSNAFYPRSNSFAFGDSLLGYAPVGMLGDGPLAATLRYNILFVLAHALLAIGGYALVRQLGAGRTGATLAAVAFAYAPWRLAQEGHLDIISAGAIPLALAMLARGHGWSLRHGLRPDHRHTGWAALGWLVAAWQVTLGFSLGLPFLGVLALILVVLLICTPIRWLRRRNLRPVLGWRLLITDMLGPLIVAGIAALIMLPYLRIANASNSITEIKFFSPPLRSLLIGPAESRLWGAPHAVPRSTLGWPAEMTLLPGFVLYALALTGLVFSVWKFWHRLVLLVALAAMIILTLGTTFFGGRWTYLPLFGHLPASLDVRIPGRLMLWVTLLLGILAAGAVADFVRRAELWSAQRIPPWPAPWLRVATLLPLALVIVEGWNATAHPVVSAQPTTMRSLAGPMLVLPTDAVTDETVLLWSTSRFQKLANGSGGFAAARQAELRRNVATFPDAASIQYLRSLNVNTVLLLRSRVAGTSWERAGDTPVDALGIRREDADNAVIFHLN